MTMALLKDLACWENMSVPIYFLCLLTDLTMITGETIGKWGSLGTDTIHTLGKCKAGDGCTMVHDQMGEVTLSPSFPDEWRAITNIYSYVNLYRGPESPQPISNLHSLITLHLTSSKNLKHSRILPTMSLTSLCVTINSRTMGKDLNKGNIRWNICWYLLYGSKEWASFLEANLQKMKDASDHWRDR